MVDIILWFCIGWFLFVWAVTLWGLARMSYSQRSRWDGKFKYGMTEVIGLIGLIGLIVRHW